MDDFPTFRCDAENCPHRAEIEIALQGVKNFRSFQLDVTAKLSDIHTAAKIWSRILSISVTIIIPTIAAIILWFFTQAYPALRQILADYYVHHPTARVVEPHADNRVRYASATDMQFSKE